MTDTDRNVSRRGLLRTAAGSAAVAAGGSGTAVAQSGNESEGGGGGGGGPPDFGGYLDDVGNFDGSVADARGQGEVTVAVGSEGNGGNLAFDPPAVHVDAGTTVVWEWTGEGGSHNVIHEGGNFESELTAEGGFTFEHTFESDGIYNYYCQPHKSLGMKGSVVVGSEFPTAGGGGGSTPLEPSHMGSQIREHYVGVSVILAISVSLVFTFFVLKYGESAHTKGGNN
jgi:halocyanin-like protein